MRRIGIIGGMSWESTQLYYRLINERVRAVKGGLSSAPLLVHSLDFAPVAAMQAAGDWDGLTALMVNAGLDLKAAGARSLAIATNTMYKMAEQVVEGTGLPLIHIADAVAACVRGAGLTRVALLATRFTMEQAFYRDRLMAAGLSVLIPDDHDRAEIHRVIYEELCRGIVREESRAIYARIMAGLRDRGAQGVILGCTEISMLVRPSDTDLPLFDTTAIHATAIADRAMAG